MNEFKLKRISAEETIPLRSTVLRPGLPATASRFDKDLANEAGHFGVFVEEQMVAVGSVYPEICEAPGAASEMKEEGAWRLRGMATDPSCRGKGYGAEVLRACLAHAKASGAKLVWAHARTGAMSLYFRHGFLSIGEEYDLPGVGPHYLIRIHL